MYSQQVFLDKGTCQGKLATVNEALSLSSRATRFGTESKNDCTKVEFSADFVAVVAEKEIRIKTVCFAPTCNLMRLVVLRAPAI